MKKRHIITLILVLLAALPIASDTMTYYRHATFILDLNGKQILVDPMFAPKEYYDPIPLTNNRRNPLDHLMIDYHQLINVDGVLITHNHYDHFDTVAQEALPKNIPILCQPEDFNFIKERGFQNVTKIETRINWLGLNIERFSGNHGTFLGDIIMGPSSSYLISPDHHNTSHNTNYSADPGTNKSVFISGDTLLTREQENRLTELQPNTVIAYGGGASINLIGRITMSNADMIKLSGLLPNAKIVAVHMNSMNHCLDTRAMLKEMLTADQHSNIVVPDYNDTIRLDDPEF